MYFNVINVVMYLLPILCLFLFLKVSYYKLYLLY